MSRWEVTENLPEYHGPIGPVTSRVALVPGEEVEVQLAFGVPKEIKDHFIRGDVVWWPKHPHNQDSTVPHASAPTADLADIFPTASRTSSYLLGPQNRAVGLKLPTTHTQPGVRSEGKERMHADLKGGLVRSEYVRAQSQKFPDAELIVLRELMAFTDKKTGNGFMVRDLEPLQDGNYYLPGFSVPSLGESIAVKQGESGDAFWSEHYAASLGRAKAKLLVRYGLQMKTPNAQNWLVQMNAEGKPTGAIVVRDINDANFVGPIAEAMGHQKRLEMERTFGWEEDTKLQPRGSFSFWRFNEGPSAMSPKTIQSFLDSHDRAYLQTINELLGLSIPLPPPTLVPRPYLSKTGSPETQSDSYLQESQAVKDAETVLLSPEGLEAIRRYHQVNP